MKTYLYIDNHFKIEQRDVNPIAVKIGGIEKTAKKTKALSSLLSVENSMLYIARTARKNEKATKQKNKRRAKYAARRKVKRGLAM